MSTAAGAMAAPITAAGLIARAAIRRAYYYRKLGREFGDCRRAGPRYCVAEMKATAIKEPVASVSFNWIDGKGKERPVQGIIGKPYQVDDQSWACAYVLDGAFDQGADIVGGDSIQALSLALYGLYHDLIRLLDEGGRLLDPKTREAFDLVTLKATFSRSTSQFHAVT